MGEVAVPELFRRVYGWEQLVPRHRPAVPVRAAERPAPIAARFVYDGRLDDAGWSLGDELRDDPPPVEARPHRARERWWPHPHDPLRFTWEWDIRLPGETAWVTRVRVTLMRYDGRLTVTIQLTEAQAELEAYAYVVLKHAALLWPVDGALPTPPRPGLDGLIEQFARRAVPDPAPAPQSTYDRVVQLRGLKGPDGQWLQSNADIAARLRISIRELRTHVDRGVREGTIEQREAGRRPET